MPVHYKDVLSHGKNVSAKHPAMYCTDAVKCESLHLITVADLPKSLWKLNLLQITGQVCLVEQRSGTVTAVKTSSEHRAVDP